MTWTPERIATLKRHWGDTTARKIGEMVDKSKNAVLGKVHRLGLSGPPNDSGKGPKPKPSKPIPMPPRSGLTWTNGCQYMEGEVRERNFCGAEKAEGSSYCEYHHVICRGSAK